MQSALLATALDIAFNAAEHTYVVDGVPCVAVSKVLEPLQMLDGIPPPVLERKRVFGQHVDMACNLLIRGELDWDSLDGNLIPYVEAANLFLKQSGLIVTGCQVRVASTRLRVAGTLDICGTWKGSECVLDFKATHDLPSTVGPQTAAYDYLYRERRGGPSRKRYCVHLMPTKYEVYALTDPGDWQIFLSALNIHHWRHSHYGT